jgi:hypothetical protein
VTVRARLIPLRLKDRADDNRRARSLTIYFSQRTHDVAVACCLAMAEVRVQLPLGALFTAYRKVWKSACFGSRKSLVRIQLRRLCLRCGPMVRQLPVKETSAGSIPAAAANGRARRMDTRRARGEEKLIGRASQWVMATVSKTVER